MTVTAKLMVAPQPLTGVDALYYTAPANATGIIKRAVFNNTTAGALLLTVNIVPAAGSSSSANQVITAVAIPPAGNPPYISPELSGQVLPPGTMLRILGAAGLNVIVNGIEIV